MINKMTGQSLEINIAVSCYKLGMLGECQCIILKQLIYMPISGRVKMVFAIRLREMTYCSV